MPGHYIGVPKVELLPDGRLMKLDSEFGFVSASGATWRTPPGMETDGASIPRFLWPIFGGPFEGKYRDAAIVHDWYCSVRSRPWEDTHLMFHEAMLVSGVSQQRARSLYLGVRFGGPRWSKMDVENVRRLAEGSDYITIDDPFGDVGDDLARPKRSYATDDYGQFRDSAARPYLTLSSFHTDEEQRTRFLALVGDPDNPQLPVSLDEINRIADKARGGFVIPND